MNNKIITPPLSSNCLAISIIIPFYNVGKYIAEELDTILEQTFQNFEVIAVDDCSTDLSCEIVESYIPKFDGRLKLYHTEENSGTAAVPRNMGLPLSSGEYVFFMDADDMFVENALEQMYTLAKKFDADVVYCDRYYSSDAFGKNLRLVKFQEGDPVEEPTLETEDMRERFQGILNQRYGPTPWLKLVRRQFLIDREIVYPELRVSDDNIWTQGLVFHAKRFLRIPDALYIFRSAPDSITRIQKPPKVKMNFWLKPALLGLKTLDKFMSTSEFFQENPDCRHAILENFLKVRFDWIFDSTRQLSETEIYEAIKDGLGEFFGDYDVVIPALTTYICRQNKMLEENAFIGVEEYKQRIAELEEAFLGLSEKINRIPAISVVIPMYNAEKYVSECLDSLLIQTFKDFEVIVVDDCSTDNSVAIVKSYADKFDGRLKLRQTEKNSGGGGYVPRNVGLSLASGEYIFFLDSDDFILASALETLYNAAKEYDAEVVYTSAFYDVNGVNKIARHRDGLGRRWFKRGVEDRLIFIENNPHELFQQFFQIDEGEGNFHACWSKFVRRDFLLKNNITFLNLVSSGDVIWCINVYAHVKRFLRLPIALYFYRAYNTTSVVRTILTPAEQTYKWISTPIAFLKGLNELQARVDFLRENPIYCQKIAEVHIKWFIDRLAKVLENLGNRDIYEIFSNKFEDDTFNGTAPFFFNIIEEKRKELLDQQLLRRLKPYITGRIDILKTSKSDNDDFEIVDVSDEKASVTSPAWFQKDGKGYVIESYAGKLEFIAKSASDGQIKLFFRGFLVVDPKDKTKRIPYWIDYTRFTVNDNVIFGKTTPAWHDKAYKHTMNIKAGEEVKFQVEWLPHRDTRPDVSEVVAKIPGNNPEKLREYEALISELRTALDNEKQAHNTNIESIETVSTVLEPKESVATTILTTEKLNSFVASVIIPMYNAEEYIGECLDSLFAQTFQDFEVIVVDDCSTDNSVKIVENYAPKFNGRLHITHTEKNSGNYAIPSNLALEIAQGEYVIFIDSNDFLLATALETLYTAAEEYEADVVYTSAFYDIRQPNDVYLLRDGAGKKMLEDGRIDKPVLTIDNPDKNLRLLLTKEREGNFCYTWTKFVRRDFLLENEITFPVISNGADFIWNINVYCHAKKFLRIPMPLYFYRRYKTQSVTQTKREPREQVLYGISEFVTWTKLLNELESKNKILSDNPAYCLAAMKSHFENSLSRMKEARDQLSAKEFYGILFNKLFAEKNLSDETVSSLLSLINVDNLANRGVRQVLEDAIQADPKFLNKFTARVDVKFISQQKGKSDFQILNVSDNKATVDKPSWLQRGGIGYQIQSYVGKLEFIAKADTNGQIKLSLKVKDIREPGDKTKRIPCWIGYTSLTVNGNEAFDTVTLAWHDKPYVYNVEAKAGEEVKIQVEWLLPKKILKNISTPLE